MRCVTRGEKKLHLTCFLNINISNEIQAKYSYAYFYQLKCAGYNIKVSVRRWQTQGWRRKHQPFVELKLLSLRLRSLTGTRWIQYTPLFKHILIFLWQGLELYTFFSKPGKNSVSVSRISRNYYVPRQSCHIFISYPITMSGEKNELWSSWLYSLLPSLISVA
jgi:hypothetical protein